MFRPLGRPFLVLVVLVALAAVACGDDESPGPIAAGQPEPTAAQDRAPLTTDAAVATTTPENAVATTAVATVGSTTASGRAVTTTAPAVRATSPPTAVPAASARRVAVVTLAGDWAPESQLSPSERAAQRARIERAQDELVTALAGHGTLLTRLTETAQLSVSADQSGLDLLAAHRLVRSVQVTTPDRPNSSN